MMAGDADKQRIVQLIYAVIDDINASRPADKHVEKSPSTMLYGSQSVLDSLGLVNLIVGVEQKIGDDLGVPVTLADEKALSQRNSPFRSVDTLADYALSLVNP
jgi:acyl carrier protein